MSVIIQMKLDPPHCGVTVSAAVDGPLGAEAALKRYLPTIKSHLPLTLPRRYKTNLTLASSGSL